MSDDKVRAAHRLLMREGHVALNADERDDLVKALRGRDAEHPPYEEWSSRFEGDVFRQLCKRGPLWDGNVASKSARNQLVQWGLVERGSGFQWLSRRGVALADSLGLLVT